MTKLLVNKSSISGKIHTPPSKSQTHRALLFATLAEGKSHIYNALSSPDSQAMADACRALGATVEISDHCMTVTGTAGNICPTKDVINAQNSGIVLRFVTALAALCKNAFTITGDHSICNMRQMDPLIDALSQLGVEVNCLEKPGFAPLTVKGPMTAGAVKVEGKDSQFVSSLLIALSFAKGPFDIQVINPGELPWVDLTLHWLKQFNIPYTREGYTAYHIPGNFHLKGFTYTVAGDLSSAAFAIGAALVTKSELTLTGIDLTDPQGDKLLIDTLIKMGAQITTENNTLKIKRTEKLQGITVDINPFIDAICILAVIACFAEGTTKIINASVARGKECDRISCLATELKKLGANIQEVPDGLIITGSELTGANVFSHDDHRMTMALAVAGLGAEGQTQIQQSACYSKTYPTFVSDFQAIGAHFEEVS